MVARGRTTALLKNLVGGLVHKDNNIYFINSNKVTCGSPIYPGMKLALNMGIQEANIIKQKPSVIKMVFLLYMDTTNEVLLSYYVCCTI